MKETRFESIRTFHDDEVPTAIASIADHPMMHAMMRYIYPGKEATDWQKQLQQIDSIEGFQVSVTYDALMRILQESSEGLTYSGFDSLDAQQSYLYISNHRDIILDTSLLNLTLHLSGLMMTASAIGDNLVRNPFLLSLAKINRNFIVQRGLPPKELLESSRLLSEYIHHLLTAENRSIWIAQREGRTKDGNDETHPGVLKMLYMSAERESVASFFRRLQIIPVAVSYEYDPTDMLKLPEIMANLKQQEYRKGENDDFQAILRGITGQKKRIHLHASRIPDAAWDNIALAGSVNQQIRMLARVIDREIIGHYRLWPTHYIAYEQRYPTGKYNDQFSVAEKQAFMSRWTALSQEDRQQKIDSLLDMYANPVIRREQLIIS